MESHAPVEVVVPLSKDKIIACLIGSIAFFFVGIWMLATADTQTGHDPLEVKALAILCISFFGVCAVWYSVKAFDRRPGLIIDEQGIVDNSSGVAIGRVFWEDVVELKISKVRPMHSFYAQRLITIFVADPKRYTRQVNFFGRVLNAGNVVITGSSINISSNALEISFDDVFYALNEAFKKYQAHAFENHGDQPKPQ